MLPIFWHHKVCVGFMQTREGVKGKESQASVYDWVE